jgi:hypothetical protein
LQEVQDEFMLKKQSRIHRGMLVGILILIMLTGCVKPTQTAITPTTELPTAETPLTSTTIPPSLLVVDGSSQAAPAVLESLQAFAAANGLDYRQNPDLNTDFTSVKIAVVLGDAMAYKDQAASHPETQFLFIGSAVEGAGGNLSLVVNRPQDMAFMAGYLATHVAEDWRSGGLLNTGTSPVGVTSDAFVNGGGFVCGACVPVYPPYMNYPLFQDVTGKTSAPEIQADVDALAVNKVETVFVAAFADQTEVLDALELAGMTLIGENTTSPNAARYAAILTYDTAPAVAELLPKLLAGEGGQTAFSRVTLASVNDSKKIPPSRQSLFAETAEALAGDWIIPLSVP